MSTVVQYLHAVRQTVIAQRAKQGSVRKDEMLEEGEIQKATLFALNDGDANISQARLHVLWWLYNNVELAGEYNDLDELLEQEVYNKEGVDSNSIARSALVVKVILTWAHANPVSLGSATIDARALMDRKGMDHKMRIMVGLFRVADDETRARIIREIWTKSQRELNEVRKAIQEEMRPEVVRLEGGGEGGEEGGAGSRQPSFKIVKYIRPNGTVRIEVPEALTYEQAASLEAITDGLAWFETRSGE